MKVERKISLNERIYLLAEELCPPFCIQFIVKGVGKIKAEAIENELEELTSKIPALQLKLHQDKWVYHNEKPKLIVHHDDFIDNWNDNLLRSKLSSKKGNCLEIHLFQGKNTTLIFRALHSLVDSKGLLLIVNSLFKKLRGEDIEAVDNYFSDESFRENIKIKSKKKKGGFISKWASIGGVFSNAKKYQTTVIDFPVPIENISAKCADWLSKKLNKKTRFLFPVDIRRHQKMEKSVANMALPIFINVEPSMSWEEIHGSLLKELSSNNELAFDSAEKFSFLIPDFVLKKTISIAINDANFRKRYPISGFLSDVGNIDLSKLSTKDFETNDAIMLPVYSPLTPFCVLICHHKNGTRLSLNIPKGVNLQKEADSLKKFILTHSIEPSIKRETTGPTTRLPNELYQIWATALETPVNEIDFDNSFMQLGGTSLDWLTVVSETSSGYIKNNEKAYLEECLNTGGRISIYELFDITKQPTYL